jgi:hypothetical protein
MRTNQSWLCIVLLALMCQLIGVRFQEIPPQTLALEHSPGHNMELAAEVPQESAFSDTKSGNQAKGGLSGNSGLLTHTTVLEIYARTAASCCPQAIATSGGTMRLWLIHCALLR